MNEKAKRQREENQSSHARYPRHPNKSAPGPTLKSSLFDVAAGGLYRAGVGCRSDTAGLGAVLPQPPPFQGRAPTAFSNEILTTRKTKQKKSTSFGFGDVQHRLRAHISLRVCVRIPIFSKRRVSLIWQKKKRRRRKKRRAMPGTRAQSQTNEYRCHPFSENSPVPCV